MTNDEVTEYRAHWDGAEARFRLFGFIFEGSEYRLEIADYWDCDVTDVIDDADYYFTDQGALWSLATVDTASAGATLTWLHGYDYRIAASSYTQWRARTDMQLRYLAARSQHSQPVVLPDGLRLIRMFPEWVGGPLWETFTDNYPAEPENLGLEQALADDLRDWNDAWAGESVDPAHWRVEGIALHQRVQDALNGIAEVAPQFLPPTAPQAEG